MYRRVLRWLLVRNWRASLTPAERSRFDYWGATGNPAHHEFSWAEGPALPALQPEESA